MSRFRVSGMRSWKVSPASTSSSGSHERCQAQLFNEALKFAAYAGGAKLSDSLKVLSSSCALRVRP